MQALDLAIRYATNGVILDTNVFLVFLVGLWNPSEISKYKRTAAYTECVGSGGTGQVPWSVQ
jgi:hypothetical protein